MGRTFFTFRSCRSYLVCVNMDKPYEAPTTSNKNGTPKTLGCFLTNRFSALGSRRRGDGNLRAIYKRAEPPRSLFPDKADGTITNK